MRCSRTPGKKSDPHRDPADPPRRRANKRRGHGTYANDRPPIVGTVGRPSGQCRLRVAARTDQATLHAHLQTFTRPCAPCYTDEWRGYQDAPRAHRHHLSRARLNGRVMMMAMVTRRHPIRVKACGRPCATSYAPFAASTRRISSTMWRCGTPHYLKQGTPDFIQKLVR